MYAPTKPVSLSEAEILVFDVWNINERYRSKWSSNYNAEHLKPIKHFANPFADLDADKTFEILNDIYPALFNLTDRQNIWLLENIDQVFQGASRRQKYKTLEGLRSKILSAGLEGDANTNEVLEVVEEFLGTHYTTWNPNYLPD